MSAPDTNTQKQAERHRGPLTGMMGVVLFALVLLAGLAIFMFSRGNTPADGAQVDGRTGATEQAADTAAPEVEPATTTGADAGEAPPADPDTELGGTGTDETTTSE